VHSGGSMAGVMLIAFGAAWNYIHLGSYETTIVWSLIASTYLMVLGMFLAAITGKRGLHSGSKEIEKIIYLLYASGGILCTLALTGILVGLIIQ